MSLLPLITALSISGFTAALQETEMDMIADAKLNAAKPARSASDETAALVVMEYAAKSLLSQVCFYQGARRYNGNDEIGDLAKDRFLTALSDMEDAIRSYRNA